MSNQSMADQLAQLTPALTQSPGLERVLVAVLKEAIVQIHQPTAPMAETSPELPNGVLKIWDDVSEGGTKVELYNTDYDKPPVEGAHTLEDAKNWVTSGKKVRIFSSIGIYLQIFLKDKHLQVLA